MRNLAKVKGLTSLISLGAVGVSCCFPTYARNCRQLLGGTGETIATCYPAGAWSERHEDLA